MQYFLSGSITRLIVTVEFDPPVTEQVDVAGAVPLACDIVQRPAGDVVAVTEKSHLPLCIHTVLSVTSPFPTPELLGLADEVTVQSAVIAPVVKVDPDREPPKQPDTDKLV